MYSLIIDTTTERGILAIAKDVVIIKEISLPFGLQNSKFALPLLRDALTQLKITPSDFTEVICGVGPGSYTGIRVGASIALSFSFAQEIKLIGVSSLQAYEPQEEGAFISVIDAKMGGAYISINDGPPQVVTLEDFKKHAQTVHQILSPVVEPLKSKLGLSCVTWYEMAPSASKMLALSKGPQAQISNDSSLELMYLQSWKPS